MKVGARRIPLLRPTRQSGAVLVTVPMSAVTSGTDRYQLTAPAAVEQPPRLQLMSAHHEPEIRIRFLDNSFEFCETPKWRCRVIRAIAKEGSGYKTGPSNLFREPQRYPGSGPKTKKAAFYALGRGVRTWLRPAGIAKSRRIYAANDTSRVCYDAIRPQ